MKEVQKDPTKLVLSKTTLPVSLLSDKANAKTTVNLLNHETFGATFGKKATRKQPKIASTSLEELINVSRLKDIS